MQIERFCEFLTNSRLDEPVHLTQFRHPIFNPDGLPESQNCGPTTLVMALRRLGLTPRGASGSQTQEAIDAARYAMFSDARGRSIDPARDGFELDRSGLLVRAPSKHQTLTDLVDLERGAANSGASTMRLPSLARAVTELGQGRPVILCGDPGRAGAYGARVGVHYRGGHFILLASFDGQAFRIADPLCPRGQVEVTPGELAAFLSARIFDHTVGLTLRRSRSIVAPNPGRRDVDENRL